MTVWNSLPRRPPAWAASGSSPCCACPAPAAWRLPSMAFAIQGVKTKATTSEINIPIEALMGIGLM